MKHRVLVVAAHPDDEVLGCGGTIIKHCQKGDEVRILIMAEGLTSRGAKRDVVSNAKALKELHANSYKAAEIMGANQVNLLSFPDNRMDSVDLLDVVKQIELVVDEFKPDIVYTHHSGDVNIDHRITHEAVVTACRPLPGQCVKTLLFFETLSSTEWQMPVVDKAFAPNWFVDIEDVMDEKIKTLQCYGSEMRDYPHSRSYEAVEILAKYRGFCVGKVFVEAFEMGRNVVGKDILKQR